MNKEYLLRITAEFSETSPTNYLSAPATSEEEQERVASRLNEHNFARNNYYGPPDGGASLEAAKTAEYVGLRFYLPPIISVGLANDPAYQMLKQPDVVGPYHMLPTDWLATAKTVICLFLPFTERVIKSNTVDPVEPSWEWLFARVDGQQHLLATAALVRDALIAEGYRAVVPQIDDRYVMRVSPAEAHLPIPTFSSNWSERHVAFIAGLGTFGLSTNFISKRGTCGRLISVVTDWETEPDQKDYEDMYDYCSKCRACYDACPASAYCESGKDVLKCSTFLRENCAKYAPRYGCGKCQAGLPCESRSFGG
ncbi:MAG: epoxyqueuosine reductase [Thermoleophilia bacterium]|nr:epoxyqueuosine reductase [Thermoleophilia bacterium]